MNSSILEFRSAPPNPSSLIETLRDIGYHIETAVADIVDNSISANAKRIDVDFVWSGSGSYITIADDGIGMTSDELVEALRPGSRSPTETRNPADLGRFGLGLKTASFSQCRSLTVFSKTEGGTVGYWTWDLNHVVQSGRWELIKQTPLYGLPVKLNRQKSGTIVLWNCLDRLTGNTRPDDTKAHARFMAVAETVKKHLAMVFHRFLEWKRFRLFFNDSEIKAWDPFLKGFESNQIIGEEFYHNGAVVVKGYVLPHQSKLSADEFRDAGGPRGWNEQQGFYIYRNERLLVSGGWLNMFRCEEHHKLARIQIDIPNTLDHEWQIDVKKSMARPPHGSIGLLQNFAKAVRLQAVEVYRHRGKILNHGGPKDHQPLWLEGKRGDKRYYQINRVHPLLTSFTEIHPGNDLALNTLLQFIEETIPIASIMIRESETPDSHAKPFEGTSHEPVRQAMQAIFTSQVGKGRTPEQARLLIANIPPFHQFPEYISLLTT